MNDQAGALNGSGKMGGQLIPAVQTVPAIPELYGSLSGYPGGLAADGPELFGLKLFDIWRILNRRKWLILGTAAAVLTLGAVNTLMKTPIYTTGVRLQVDRPARIVESGNDVVEQGPDFEFMQTQYELLRSFSMAERVASTLKLGSDTDFFKSRSFSIVGAVKHLLGGGSSADSKDADKRALQDAAAGVVVSNVEVRGVPNSRLIDVTYSDPDPARAQRIANAYAEAYVATNIDKRFQANATAKTFLEDKIQQLKTRLEDSEKKLLTFAQEQQITDVTDKTSIAESNLASANKALGELISDRTKNELLWRQLEASDGINLPQLLSNAMIEGLRAEHNKLAAEYQERLQTFKPGYPAMVQLGARIKEIDQQLATEVRAIKDSLKAAYEASLAQEKDMQKRVADMKRDLLDLQERSIQYNILKREADTNRDLYASLLQRYKEVDVASGVGANNVFVVDHAGLPGSPSSPNLRRALTMSLILGLAAGLAAAYGLERIDTKISSPEQIELVSGLPILGVIPKTRRLEEELRDPRSAPAEAYRSLCTALMFATENGLPKTLAITSCGPSEGKSFTSMCIAKHFATVGRKVLLIDADLRNPSLHVKLDRDNSIGLSNCLTGACTPPEAMQKTDIPNMALIASGPLPPNAADLLGGARLLSLLSIGSEVFDLIVIDGPPVLGLADAQLLSNAAAATVFIVGAGQVRPGFVRASLRHLQLSRGSVIGAVLTKYDNKAAGYGYGYDYGYGYGYGHRYAASAPSKEPSSDNSTAPTPLLANLRERLENLGDKA
jgi:succinoglycan biosynthesis transport protein ExoP